MNWQAADIGAGIIFNGGGYAAAWNGQMWIAVGTGSNTMAYSYDGIHWTGLGTSTFSTSGNGIAWNGTIWVAVGNGTNFIAYSNDGITWNSISQSWIGIGQSVAWNGTLWVAVGAVSDVTLTYSYDGINWNYVNDPFGTFAYGVAWNGSQWVAVGSGTNSIAYSYDGINWTGADSASIIFSGGGNGITWNGFLWVATGQGSYNIATSPDGINWTPYLISNNFTPIAITSRTVLPYVGTMLTQPAPQINATDNFMLAVGITGGGGAGAALYYTQDGNNWINASPTGTSALFTSQNIRNVAYNGACLLYTS